MNLLPYTYGVLQMLKKLTLGIALLSTSLFSQAGIINDITGADMAGIEVTAHFDGGVTDTQVWSAFSPTSGGVITNDWSLTLDGQTFGEYDNHNDSDPTTGTFYGLWELTNLLVPSSPSNNPIQNLDLLGLTINSAVANIYFDIIEGSGSPAPGSGDYTPGSGAGMPFDSPDLGNGVNAVFSNLYSAPDMFGTMEVTGLNLAAGNSTVFLTDTDKVEVPEPSTLFTFALGLMALASLRKKSLGK
jgi:hypothetical protein